MKMIMMTDAIQCQTCYHHATLDTYVAHVDRQIQEQVTKREHTLLSKRGLAAHAGLPQVALPPGRVRGKSPDAARLYNVQRRLGNRLWVGGGQCRCCGSFQDPQSEHAETCSTAEATRGHYYACVHAVVCGMELADPGITTEPRGLTADIFTTAAVTGRSAALDVCWPPPLQRQLAETQHRPLLNANSRTTEMKLRNCPLIWTVDGRPDPAVIRTLQYADIASSRIGQQMSAKSLQLFAGIIIEPCITGDISSLLTVDLATATMPTPRLTQRYQTATTTSPLSPAVRSSLCSHESYRVFHPTRGGLFLAGDGFSECFRKRVFPSQSLRP